MIEMLMRNFLFEKPVIIESIGQGSAVVATKNSITIQCDAESERKDYAELLSLAKLGEIDPLLATFYFQSNLTEEEEGFSKIFFYLCSPLQLAWAYKIMRRYAPSAYESEIQKLIELVEEVSPDHLFSDNGNINLRTALISTFAVLYESPLVNTNLVLNPDQEYFDLWSSYFETLFKLSKEEPDTLLYLTLVESTGAPFAVEIVNGKHKHFIIRKR